MGQKENLLKMAVERLTTLVTLARAGSSAIYINTQSSASPIKDALDAITDNDETHRYSIFVAPGIYTEDNPIQGKSYVTVEAEGMHTVRVVAGNADEDLFLGVNLFYLIGFSFVDVVGATNYAINHSAPGEMVVKNCVATDCSNGILVNHASALMNLLDCALYTPTILNMQKGINVLAGNVTISLLKVVADSTMAIMLNVDGTNATCLPDTVQSTSPNVSIGINVDNDASVAGFGIKMVRMVDGLVVSGTSSNVKLNTLQILAAQNDGFRVDNVGTDIVVNLLDTTVSECAGFNFNILNPNCTIVGNGFTEIANSFIVDGAKFYAAILDITEGEAGLHILGELNVGNSVRPVESVFGGGDSHIFEYVYTETSGGVFTDQTVAAVSFSGSTLAFDGVDADSAIYIGNRYPIVFQGIKIAIETAAVMGAGSIISEYWDGGAWVEFNGCTSESEPGFLKYAKNYLDKVGNFHIKYNPNIESLWATNDPIDPVLGESLYWIRYRIVTAITSSPVIQQIKIHTSRAEINTDGTFESHGDARTYKKLSLDAAGPIEGNMQSADIYVDENVGVAFTNNRYTATTDIYGLSFELPEDCDTSAPLILAWKGKSASTGNIQFTVRTKIVKPGDPYTNTEPGASGETITVLTTIRSMAVNIREDFRVSIDISNAIPSREGGFGDEIWITIQPTTLPGNFDHTKYSANYLSDFVGRHLKQ